MYVDFIYFIIIVNVINLDGMHEHAFHLVYWAYGLRAPLWLPSTLSQIVYIIWLFMVIIRTMVLWGSLEFCSIGQVRGDKIPLDETPIDVIVEYEYVWVSYITYTLHEHIVGGMFPKAMKRTWIKDVLNLYEWHNHSV